MANYTILLIDYEPRSIERFRDPLVGAGYGIEIATDGVSGIEAFHRLNPDMVLVEAMIPKKHGFEVCQELKRTPHGRKTPVIITTGVYKGRKYRTQALHIYGCDEYIEKPIAPEQLLEIVGRFLKPGPSGSPPRSSQSGSGESDAGGGSEPQATSPSVAKTVSSMAPTAAPFAFAADETEGEIMACLDAMIPTGDRATPNVFGASGSAAAAAAAVDPIALASIEPVTAVDEDPFAEMRAELNAELGALPDALDLESVPTLESLPGPFPSDQALAPSVLEALPMPEAELPTPQPPPPPPVVPVERAGQVVDFDTKRSRKNKKQNKGRAPQAAEATRPAQAVSVGSAQEAAQPRALEPVASVAELTLPRGTLVESQLEAPVARRGVPVWVWAVVGVVAVVGVYFMFSRDMPDRSVATSTPMAPSRPEPIVSTSPEPPPQAPETSSASAPVPVAEAPAPVLETPKIVASKKPVEKPPTRLAAVTAATPPASPPTRVAQAPTHAEPAPTHVTKAQPAAAPPTAPSAPAGLDDGVAGVETLPDPTTTSPAATVAPGALIPIDEADTTPTSLSRKPPVYSELARQMRLTGTVVMNVLINEKGTVDQAVLVIGVPGADLNESAMRAAKSWTYRPATKNGVPVKVWKSEQIVFKR
jgi:TonB family protein